MLTLGSAIAIFAFYDMLQSSAKLRHDKNDLITGHIYLILSIIAFITFLIIDIIIFRYIYS